MAETAEDIRPEGVEHQPWIGDCYADGLGGQKLLLVGFSHWGRYSDEEEDNPDFTRSVVRSSALTGQIRFFNAIADYFQAADKRSFWNSVAFANTLPTTVGDEDERYSSGTREQRAAVDGRALRLIAELEPDRVFVFSKKGWPLWPEFTGSHSGKLRVEGVGEFDAGTYRHGDREALAFGFPHPQYTPVAPTRIAVQAALRATPADLIPHGQS